MHRRDISRALLATAAGATVTARRADAQTCTAACFPQTRAESKAGVTPVDFTYPPGHLYRYGSNLNPPGSNSNPPTDMTQAVQSWAKVGGELTMPIAEADFITHPDDSTHDPVINLTSNSTLTLAEGATFVTNTTGRSVFKALGQSNIVIRGGKICQQTPGDSTPYIGLIEFNSCTNCTVESVELVGAQWGGVFLSDSSSCHVRGCYVHGSSGIGSADEDSHDIACYRASSFNVIEGNICNGGLAVEHGVMILDPGGSALPMKNVVANNRVGPHKCYGILNYLIDHANTWCQIIGNEVEGITGTSLGGGSGMGIYNQGAGGTVIANNTVRNCCINTSAFSLIPAGICLNLDPAMMPVNCIGNHVSDIVGGQAAISVSAGPANIEGNVVVQSAGMITNNGIFVNSANNVKVSGNHITIDPGIATATGVISLTGANVTNISITGNYILGCSSAHVRVDTTGTSTTTNVTVSANVTSSISSNCIPLRMGSVNNGAIAGNSFATTGNIVMTVNASMQCMFTGNVLAGSAAAPAVILAGLSSGSYFDKSNMLGTFVDNQSTGMTTQLLRVAPPGAGYHSAVGDRIEQQVPVVGNPKGWRCTVSGNPGTWVSEGAL